MKKIDHILERWQTTLDCFACPLCSSTMALRQGPPNSLVCVNNHVFDISRKGLVTFHQTGSKRNKLAGYPEFMFTARRAMADQGFFAPLAEALAEATPASTPLRVLDSGTGEGAIFLDYLNRFDAPVAVGFDIATAGIRQALRDDTPPSAVWCVANGRKRLPFADNAFDVILNVLAPANAQEFQRVLKPDGTLLRVRPLSGHLRELRDAIYEGASPETEPQDPSMTDLPKYFANESGHELQYTRQLERGWTEDVLYMSPIHWKGKRDRIEALKQNGLSQLTVHVALDIYKQAEHPA